MLNEALALPLTAMTAQHVTRRSVELAGLRAAAVHACGQSAYRRSIAEPVLATLDWLEGVTAVTPTTGDVAEPTPETVTRERLRAQDAEDEARRHLRDGRYPGKVSHTLSWFGCDEVTESPL